MLGREIRAQADDDIAATIKREHEGMAMVVSCRMGSGAT
jgi:hypothetical protein